MTGVGGGDKGGMRGWDPSNRRACDLKYRSTHSLGEATLNISLGFPSRLSFLGPPLPSPRVPACSPSLGQVSPTPRLSCSERRSATGIRKGSQRPPGPHPTPEQGFQEGSKGGSGPGCTGYARLQTAGQQNSSWAILSVRSTGIRSV